jgi:uncharacterized protein
MLTKKAAELIRDYSRRSAAADPAHDFAHCERVWSNATKIARKEGGNWAVLEAAAFLHDIANLPKNHPESHLSSEKSAKQAAHFIRENSIPFTEEELVLLDDAILCHSFSRGLTPKTLEGKIFQDADRLDSLGAIGIARTYSVGGVFGAKLYAMDDPFRKTSRELNDKENTLDHFYRKLLGLASTMLTQSGREMAEERVQFLRAFIEQLEDEVGSA